MRKLPCYGLMAIRYLPGSPSKQNGEFATSRINRRALLLHSSRAVFASSVAATTLGAEALGRDQEPSNNLRALIEAHKAAYAAFGEALHGTGGDTSGTSREEERALLAICGYVAGGEEDRVVKAQYLLEIEARGELDLAEHMQAILRSTMWKG